MAGPPSEDSIQGKAKLGHIFVSLKIVDYQCPGRKFIFAPKVGPFKVALSKLGVFLGQTRTEKGSKLNYYNLLVSKSNKRPYDNARGPCVV